MGLVPELNVEVADVFGFRIVVVVAVAAAVTRAVAVAVCVAAATVAVAVAAASTSEVASAAVVGLLLSLSSPDGVDVGFLSGSKSWSMSRRWC